MRDISTTFNRSQLAIAVALAAVTLAQAQAQPAPEPATQVATPEAKPAAEATAASEAKNDGLQLDKVIVTGTSGRSTKMKSSVSVSTLGEEQIKNANPSSSAELLRSVPGVRAESSGGEGNANVAVRGIPISAGGGRYVQFQEDGLPIFSSGEMNFATPDAFMRVDNATGRLEVVRGGTASTLASGAPGGIFNFVTKTGEEQGGVASLTKGLGSYDQTRLEFGYGGRAGEKTRFYIGGHQRTGEGSRNGGVNVEQGGQLRANVTQELDNGFIRLSYKNLDDRSPTLLPVPVRFSSTGQISERSGIDPRTASFYTPYWIPDQTLTSANGRVSSNINDGQHVKTNAVGVEADLDVGGGWRLQNKFRTSKNTGRFIGVFPGNDPAPAAAGTTYLNGPNAGRAYTGDAFTAVVFNTSYDDLSLLVNDLKMVGDFNLGSSGKLTTTAGLYLAKQRVAMTWNFNQYMLEASGDRPALLSSPGFVNGSAGFGGCCMNTIDATYTTTAPYGVVAWELGSLNLDASVRADKQKASGTYNQTGLPGGSAGVSYNLSGARVIDYSVKNTSYSLGGNYRITKDLAVFGRYSSGASFPTDRLAFFSPANQVNGVAEIPLNEVDQLEFGTKWRGTGLSLFVTAFAAKTKENNTDFTASPIRNVSTEYEAKGIEFEGSYVSGGFSLGAGVTLTDAEVKASSNAAIVGKEPRRQARVVYQITPSYSVGDFSIGASVIGTSKSKDDGPAGNVSVELPAYTVVNAFATYQLGKGASFALGVNNLFDTLAYTETNDGRQAARALNGRTIKATLAYAF
jgi:outer membrane receptor protein involved in Fe transport